MKLYRLSYNQPTMQGRKVVPGKTWYVAQRPGDGGVDWGYTEDINNACALSEHWRRRFVALHGKRANAIRVST